MDTVKVVISIGESSIQLEGPQEFVEKYLEKYDSIIESWNVSPVSIRPVEKESVADKEQKEAQKKKRIRKTSAGPVCSDKIRELLNEGFFKELKGTAEVTKALQEIKGLRYESNLVSATLISMFDRNELQRTFKGKRPYYYSNV